MSDSDRPKTSDRPKSDAPPSGDEKAAISTREPVADNPYAPSAGGARPISGRPPPSSRKAQPKASVVRFKAALRREIRKRHKDPEIDYLNITAMLDLMTIILVFLLMSMASSTQSIQENNDLRLARSVMTGDPSDEGVILVISKSAILLGEGGDPVVKLPSREQLAQSGLDAQYKRSGPSDLFIVPLGRQLETARRIDKAVRAAKHKPPGPSDAIIIADAQTPYRLLIEVLYTLGQSEFGKYHLLVMKKRT